MGTDHTEAVRVVAEAQNAALCKCGHRYDQHDPEDGECDSPARLGLPIGKCRCECFRTPDPNLTTTEYLASAGVGAHLAATVEPDCPTCGGTRFVVWPDGGGHPEACEDCPPSRYLVVVDAERDGKLRRVNYHRPVFGEVPPEEGADR